MMVENPDAIVPTAGSRHTKMRIFVYECVCAGGLGTGVPASLRAEGWAMLAAVAEDFRRLPGVEVATLVDDRHPFAVGDVCMRSSQADEFAHFRAAAARCDGTLVIAPEFDGILRARSQVVLDQGGRLLGSLPAAIEQTGDKWTTACHWASHGVPHPVTELLTPAAPPGFDLPWVLKPRQGAGSQATFLIRARQEKVGMIDAAFREWPGGEFIVQQYVPGAAASIALLVGTSGIVPLLPARQRISDDGRFRYLGGSLPLPGGLAQRAERLGRQAVAGIPGLQGYVGVDLVLGDRENGGDDRVIEINPRLTTSYMGLRRLCRQNLADLILACALGKGIATPTWLDGEIEFRPDALDSFSAREKASER